MSYLQSNTEKTPPYATTLCLVEYNLHQKTFMLSQLFAVILATKDQAVYENLPLFSGSPTIQAH